MEIKQTCILDSPDTETDAHLLDDARENWMDYEYLGRLAKKAKSTKVRDEILDLEKWAWKRYDLCEDFS